MDSIIDKYGLWSLLFIASIPLAFKLVPPNAFYGYRTTNTTADPEVWRRANVFLGRATMVTSAVGGLIIYFFPNLVEHWETLVLVGFVLLDLAVTFIYVNIILYRK